MSSDKGSKTEPATPQQRKRARERGQVARSVELVSAILLFMVMLLIFKLDDWTAGRFITLFRDTAGQAGEFEVTHDTMPLLAALVIQSLLIILAPFLLASFLIALLVNFMQVGLKLSSKPLKPDLKRLNPISGFKKMFSMRSFVDFIKNILKMIVVGAVAFAIMKVWWPGILTVISMEPFTAIDFAQSVGFRIAMYCSGLLLIIGILDYIYQRYEHEKSIRMSKQEIKDEYKNMEGDPMIKRRIREMGREIAMSRMLDQLQTADAVITNPTHYAVAIRFELDWPAPMVVAKGADYMALRLIRYAEDLEIPVYEQPSLARALFNTEIDDYIPGNLFKTVARVLATLSRTDQKLKRKLRGLKPSEVSQ